MSLRFFWLLLWITLPSAAIAKPPPTPLVATAPVDSRIRVHVVEDRFEDPGDVRVVLVTERVYGGTPTYLVHRLQKLRDGVAIRLSGVTSVGPLDETGPASATISLGRLATGTHRLRLVSAKDSADARVVVSSGKIELSCPRNPRFTIERAVLRRIPDNLVWGEIEHFGRQESAVTGRFLEDLRKAGATPTPLPPGDYEYFRVDPRGDLIPGSPTSTAFALSCLGDFQTIERIVHAYAGTISIRCWTAQGKYLGNR